MVRAIYYLKRLFQNHSRKFLLINFYSIRYLVNQFEVEELQGI